MILIINVQFLALSYDWGGKNQGIVLCLSFRAVGNMTYGSAYREKIVDKLRKAAEQCDCLQCFFLIHSMGGGKALIQGHPFINASQSSTPSFTSINSC